MSSIYAIAFSEVSEDCTRSICVDVGTTSVSEKKDDGTNVKKIEQAVTKGVEIAVEQKEKVLRTSTIN